MSHHIAAALVTLLLHLTHPISAQPTTTSPSSPTPSPSTDQSSGGSSWTTAKQIGIVVACVLGGGLSLFLWAWFLKGNKIFRGSRVLSVLSRVGWSKEIRERAQTERAERLAKEREEMVRIWGEDAVRAGRAGNLGKAVARAGARPGGGVGGVGQGGDGRAREVVMEEGKKGIVSEDSKV